MPRVKQTKMRLELDPGKTSAETIVYVEYDNQDTRFDWGKPKGRFFVKLPPVVATALGKTEVRAEDQDKAMDAFNEAIALFKQMKTERSKVILYSFTMFPDPRQDKEHQKYWSGGNGIRVEIWAGIYEEVVAISGDGSKRYSYEPIEPGLPYDGDYYHRTSRDTNRIEFQVPLTDENVAFFTWVASSMTALIARLAEMNNPAHLIESINAGKLLPLGRAEH